MTENKTFRSTRIDKVGIVGMSLSGSTYMTVRSFTKPDGREVPIVPPITVVLEGIDITQVSVCQDSLAARYSEEDLNKIGNGSPIKGLNDVIGDIALNGNLVYGNIKPLHPNIIDVA